jgi:hypothetical protein
VRLERPLQSCWERFFPGRNPHRVLIGENCVAIAYIDDQGQGGSPGPFTAVCLELNGNERWTVRNVRLECALFGGRFVGVMDSGEPCVLSAKDGLVEDCGILRPRITPGGATLVWRQGKHVFIRHGTNQLLVADLQFRVIRRVESLSASHGAFFVDGHIYLKSGSVVLSDFDSPRVLCRVPVEMAEAAMNRWEDESGVPALAGSLIVGPVDLPELPEAIADPSRQRPLRKRERLGGYRWLLGAEPDAGVLFLANADMPHLVVCIGLDGQARWCAYLSGGCCGGLPHALPNGSYVVSSGCGGVLSWIDRDGNVVFQSKRQDGIGLDSAYSSRLSVFSDSSCVVDGGPGIVAFDPDGRIRWTWKYPCSSFACDPGHDQVVATTWRTRDDNSKVVSIACARGLGFSSFVC